MPKFELCSAFQPTGDQPTAIDALDRLIFQGNRYQTLWGVTGSGKTFTVANLIQKIQRPTLVIAHNKTLAAQLYQEFKEFFPRNAVEYFVSYYDYYQPEAYLPQIDTYIEKDSSINEEIDKLRQRATMSILTRRDTIIVSSVSCIYGLGSPEVYSGMVVNLKKGESINREEVIRRLIDVLYERNQIEFSRGKFRVNGDIIEIYPSYDDLAIRVDFFGEEIDKISQIDPLTGIMETTLEEITIFPAKHWVTPTLQLRTAIDRIRLELQQRIEYFKSQNKLIEAQRIEQRTNYDLEMMLELGYCNGIENYSRHLTGRAQGTPSETLIDYLPSDALIVVDESHVTIPQIRGMCAGDRSRKGTLIDFGFRLPSAYDNRPLTFDEFHQKIHQILFVSATPGDWEMQISSPQIIEQVVRPTGLLDPVVEIRPVKGQIDDLINEIHKNVQMKYRVLVTTLTKRMSEDLTEYLRQLGIKVRYLHSVIETLERVEILRGLRLGEFDVLVGVNLLREGLDLPEVSLVAILDADKEGFLRSDRSLIQTIGRCARNIDAKAIFYAEKITDSMKKAIDTTNRRRKIQQEYNETHHITPQTIIHKIQETMRELGPQKTLTIPQGRDIGMLTSDEDIAKAIRDLERKMKNAAKDLDFEAAAVYRDELTELKNFLLGLKK